MLIDPVLSGAAATTNNLSPRQWREFVVVAETVRTAKEKREKKLTKLSTVTTVFVFIYHKSLCVAIEIKRRKKFVAVRNAA